ncbi:hypothetical protein [uncultured Aquimarina sp.]|uniref:hypothetical protein n=1 Tax=uncultured Aquimarina sp. TaxID=575652 RepID=UPI002617BF89|nr:hypothetical protein [uncultured Aquimarina sp.]
MFFFIYAVAQQDFNNSEYTLYRDVILKLLHITYLQRLQPTLLIATIIMEKRAIYITKAYQDFANKLDSISIETTLSD